MLPSYSVHTCMMNHINLIAWHLPHPLRDKGSSAGMVFSAAGLAVIVLYGCSQCVASARPVSLTTSYDIVKDVTMQAVGDSSRVSVVSLVCLVLLLELGCAPKYNTVRPRMQCSLVRF